MSLLVKNTALRDAFRVGDRKALTDVYMEYSKGLFAMLLKGFYIEAGGKSVFFRGYKDPRQLENAVQEIFLRAFSENARTSYDGVRPYKNYLMTIARNYVVDVFRKSSREFVSIEDVSESNLNEYRDIGESDNPETSAVNQKMKDETEKFIVLLNKEDRLLFDARFIEGRSVEDCSAYLGISEYRVKRDEKRIRKSFFVYMRQRGFFEGYQYINVSAILSVWFLFAQITDWGSN